MSNPDRAHGRGAVQTRRAPATAGAELRDLATRQWTTIADALAGDDHQLRSTLDAAARRAPADDVLHVAAEIRPDLLSPTGLHPRRLEQAIAGYVITRQNPTPGRQTLRSAIAAALTEPAVQRRLGARRLEQHRAFLTAHGHAPTPQRARSRRRR